MTKTKGATSKQINAVRTYARKGWSANRIQRKLRARHMGMRRTKLLGYVREFKQQKPKPSVSQYVPHRYRRGVPFGGFIQKRIAVWRGNRRVQMVGSGEQLKQAMKYVIKHPPKKQFLTVDAEALLNDPDEYLEKDRWSARPNVESR